jgi:hypothetical protein
VSVLVERAVRAGFTDDDLPSPRLASRGHRGSLPVQRGRSKLD